MNRPGKWIASLLLIGTLGWVVRDNFRFTPAPEAVRPADPAGLDPEVRELLEAKLAVLARQPASAAAHGDLGLVYEANDLWPEAAASFASAARLAADTPRHARDADSSEALWAYHQAVALERAGDAQGGRRLLEQAAEQLPDEPGVALRLGYARLDAGELDRAEEAFARVARAIPERPEPYVALGELQVARGNHAEAARELERALELEEAPRIAHYALGLAYRGLGRMEEAERELLLGQGGTRPQIGDRLLPRLREYAVNYASVVDRASQLIDAGSPAEAARLLERSLARRPDDTNLLNNLAIADLRQGNVERARERLERALELDERAFATHQNLAACALQQEDLARALRHAERAVELGADVASTHFVEMQVLAALGRFDEAYAAAAAAAQLDPADITKRVALAELCLQLRRFDEARRRFEEVLVLAPDFLPAHLNLISALVLAGDLERAQTALAVVERLEPGHARVAFARRTVERALAERAASGGGD